ncbi:MAG: hypothetical protein ABIK89_12520 [Planctomycetota bacterium]
MTLPPGAGEKWRIPKLVLGVAVKTPGRMVGCNVGAPGAACRSAWGIIIDGGCSWLAAAAWPGLPALLAAPAMLLGPLGPDARSRPAKGELKETHTSNVAAVSVVKDLIFRTPTLYY